MGLHQLACVGISIRSVVMHGILAPTNEWRIMCQPLFCQLMMLRANSVAYHWWMCRLMGEDKFIYLLSGQTWQHNIIITSFWTSLSLKLQLLSIFMCLCMYTSEMVYHRGGEPEQAMHC